MVNHLIGEKMSTIKNIEDIKALIDGGVEESTTLEYKRNFAKQNPHWKRRTCKGCKRNGKF